MKNREEKKREKNKSVEILLYQFLKRKEKCEYSVSLYCHIKLLE